MTSSPILDPQFKLAYRLGELAKLTSLSTFVLRTHIRSGKLPARKIGTAVLILAEDAKAWLKNQPVYEIESQEEESAG